MMGAIMFRCLNLWYAKSFHPNVMKLTVSTKLNLRVLYMELLSNWRIYQYIIALEWNNI